MSNYSQEEFDKLYEFFRSVADMTLNHNVIDDHACVTADKLGQALEKVDKNWCNIR